MSLEDTLKTLRDAEVAEAEFHADGTLRHVIFGPAVVAVPEGEEQPKDTGLKSAARGLMRLSEVKNHG